MKLYPFNKKRGNRFYKTLFLFAVVMFCVAAVILALHLRNMDALRKQREASVDDMAKKVLMNASTITEEFESFCNTMSRVRVLQEIAALEDVSAASEKMQQLCQSYRFAASMFLPGSGTTTHLYFSNSGRTVIPGNPEMDLYRSGELTGNYGLTEEDWEKLSAAGSETVSFFLRTEIMDFTRLMLARQIAPSVVLTMGISEEALMRKMNLYYLPEESQILMVSDNDVSISFSEEAAPEEIPLRYADAAGLQAKSMLPHGDGRYFAYHTTVPHSSIEQVVLIPDTIYPNRSGQIAGAVLLAFFCWMLFGLSISYALSSVLYRPIERLLDKLRVESQDEPKLDEFTVIDSAFQTLRKENLTYEEQLHKQNRMLSDSLFLRLLHGNISYCDDIEEILESAGFPVNLRHYCVLLVRPNFYSGNSSQDVLLTADQMSLTSRRVRELLQERISQFAYSSYFVEIFDCVYSVVGFEQQQAQELLQNMETMRVGIQSTLDIVLSVFLSGPQTSMLTVDEAFQQVMQTEEYSLLVEEHGQTRQYAEALHCFGNAYSGVKVISYVYRITNCIQSEQFDDAISLLQEMFRNLSEHTASSANVKQQIGLIQNAIFLSVSDIPSVDQKTMESLVNDPPLHKEKNLDSLCKRLCGLLQSLKRAADSEEEGKKTRVTKIAEYIQKNYCDPALSATSVSEQFGISLSWLSNLFKKEWNMGFLDYLHKCRIDKARELIVSTNENIADIAQRVGYANTLTMYRAFKRYEGVAPGWYRQNGKT